MSRLLYEFVLCVMKNPIVEDPLPLQPENYVLKLCETLLKNRNHKLVLTTTVADFWNYSYRSNRLHGFPLRIAGYLMSSIPKLRTWPLI
ncbi:hypothetical protein T08_14322 [Trichinella sp. T8]|nr:hypothetical protein T08_14322 [Trichinella sp. T8]